jgi:hypothetical protein
VISALVANAVSLIGLLFFGWSIWMALAVFWLENLVSTPFAAVRLRLAIPAASEQDLEAFVAQQSNGSKQGQHYTADNQAKLRATLASGGRPAMAGVAIRLFVPGALVFVLIQGAFVYLAGISNGHLFGYDLIGPNPIPIFPSPFDVPALLTVAALMSIGEAARIVFEWWRYRTGGPGPALPDEAGINRREAVVHFAIVLGGLAFFYLGKPAYILAFIGLKTVLDLGALRRPKR